LYDLREHLVKLADSLGRLIRAGAGPSWLLVAVKGSYAEIGHLALVADETTTEVLAAIARAETLLELCGISPPTGPARVIDFPPPVRPPSAGSTVLVVEDDQDLQFTLRGVLEEHGYRVAAARDGQEALSLLARISPALIMVDLTMPVMDGWQLIEQVKNHREWKWIPICVISAHARLATPGQIVAALRKPLDLTLLLDTVARYAVPKSGVG